MRGSLGTSRRPAGQGKWAVPGVNRPAAYVQTVRTRMLGQHDDSAGPYHRSLTVIWPRLMMGVPEKNGMCTLGSGGCWGSRVVMARSAPSCTANTTSESLSWPSDVPPVLVHHTLS